MTPAWDPEAARRMVAQLRLPNPPSRALMEAIAGQIEAALALSAALREACDLATPVTAERAREVCAEGYLVGLQPMFAQIGDVVIADRLAELRALAGDR